MSLADALSGEAVPCKVNEQCMNSPLHRGPQSQCIHCKFALQMPGTGNFWKPWNKNNEHPAVVEARTARARERKVASTARRKAKDRGKQKLQAQAQRAEETTSRKIINATKNSGRTGRDADHVHAGRISLDTKLQTGSENPRVVLAELDKVRRDARRGGNALGALVIRNKHGRGVIVFDEEDYARLFADTVRNYVKEIVHAGVQNTS